jgi:hypothetical protein
LQCLPYPSNRTIHSICYREKERLANGKREFKEERKKSSRIIKSGKSREKRNCIIGAESVPESLKKNRINKALEQRRDSYSRGRAE